MTVRNGSWSDDRRGPGTAPADAALPSRRGTAGALAEPLQGAVVVTGEPATLDLNFSAARGALRHADFLIANSGLAFGANAAIERCLQRGDGLVIGGLPDFESLDPPALFPGAFAQAALDLHHVRLGIAGVYSH